MAAFEKRLACVIAADEWVTRGRSTVVGNAGNAPFQRAWFPAR